MGYSPALFGSHWKHTMVISPNEANKMMKGKQKLLLGYIKKVPFDFDMGLRWHFNRTCLFLMWLYCLTGVLSKRSHTSHTL